ncbi:hypothetical protein QJS10_CPB21g00049 [Acorus calamus]|uniref:Chloroplast J-like domain 1 n=1 Tax=Acorus calamus TaxID=4465 RepID=A0AAV9C325_ACOCL|nr:hypothetical protein QJS10_CPB21g00049 [Acorus calamus]
MAILSTSIKPPCFRISPRTGFFHSSTSHIRLVSPVRVKRLEPRNYRLVCKAASSAGSPNVDGEENPYEVLGVNPIVGFDMIKMAYTRKRKDAERQGDEAAIEKLERAYDKIMMKQLTNRKKGLTFGSFQVSKDIKFADNQPIVPWGPRFSRSSVKDMKINIAISSVFAIWSFIQRQAEWKPLQFLGLVFFYRIFEKLKSFEPATSPTFTEDGEDEGRGMRMGKRLLRSLALVFGCIALSSLAYTGILNAIEILGFYIPLFLYNNQEMIVTTASAIILYFLATYYR